MFTYSRRRNTGFTLWELLAVVGVIAVVMALIVPAINSATASSRKNQCRSRFRQLGLSLATYEEANKSFPALYFRKVMKAEQDEEKVADVPFNADPTLADQEYSWMVKILPYMEEKNLYDQISSGSGIFSNDPSSVKVVNAEGKQISASQWESYNIRCPEFPSDIGKYPGATNYVTLTATKQQLLTVGKNNPTLADGLLVPSDMRKYYRGIKAEAVKDGVSKTLMVTESVEQERSNWLHWQQTFVCGFLPGDTSVTNNDPLTGVPRVEQDQTWIFNKNAGDRTALNFGPRDSSNLLPYNAMPNDPLRRKFGPSSVHVGDVVINVNADASIREIVSTGIDAKVYYSAITRDGNEKYNFED